jgi:DNA-binding NarL/FixJ family response regulator
VIVTGPRAGRRGGELRDGARVRVVIADDTYLVREALEQILAHADGIDVAGSCADRDSLLRAIEEEHPDVVLTDIRMPPTGTDEGIQVARQLRTTHPEIGVVVLSQFVDPGYVLTLLESGSAGRAYLLKERVSDPRELADAVKTVASGGSAVDSKVIEVLIRARRNGASSPLRDLTPREHEVLAELAQGKSNGAIAESLVLTKRAVEKHINAIFMKLNLAPPDDVSPRVKATLAYLANDNGRPAP